MDRISLLGCIFKLKVKKTGTKPLSFEFFFYSIRLGADFFSLKSTFLSFHIREGYSIFQKCYVFFSTL